MANDAFTDEEFDQLEQDVAAIFFSAPAEEVEEAVDGRISRILSRVEQNRRADEEG